MAGDSTSQLTAATVVTGHDLPPHTPFRRLTGYLVRRNASWVALIDVILIIIFGTLHPNLWSVQGAQTLASDSVETLLLAVGSAVLLGSGQFDISVGANLGLSSVVAVLVMQHIGGVTTIAQYGISHQVGGYHNLQLAIPVGLVSGVFTGMAVGLVNGLVVVKLRVNSLIATLGMLSIAEGITFVMSNGVDLAAPTQLVSSFGQVTIAAIPLPVIVAAIAVVVFWFIIAKTDFGLRTLAIGSHRQAAARAGIDVTRQQIVLFVITGTLAGVAGIVDIGRFDFTNAAGHVNDALAAISAAVIGGTALLGGSVSIVGTVFGVLLTTVLEVGLVLSNVSSYYQLLAIGVLLIVVVSIYQTRRVRALNARS